MLQTDDLEKVICHIIDLTPSCEVNSVVFGLLDISENPALVQAVMEYVTRFYDVLLRKLSLNPANRIALQMQRCFTETEYNMLFDFRERDFSKPIFKTLLITNHTDRLLFTLNRTASHASFLSLLKSWSEVHNPVLYKFLYGDTFGTTTQA